MRNYYYKMYNGVEIPSVGLGTWKMTIEEAELSVAEALKSGYRHIDTAAAYGNEAGVGQGIKESGIPREEIFITSKLWNTRQGYETTLEAFEKTLQDIGVDYLDLYLIHWPIDKGISKEKWRELNRETWKAFEYLYQKGKIRAIGLSNFLPHHIKNLMETAEIKPMVNQLEIHPGMPQTEAVKYSKEHNMVVEAWSPFSTGRIFEVEEMQKLSRKYRRTVAQLCIRWNLQMGNLPIPKSKTPDRIRENMEVFDFEIDTADMQVMDGLTECGWSGLDPDNLNY